MITIAIDPGLSGGISYKTDGEPANAVKMPDTPRGIASVFEMLVAIEDEMICYLEDVHGMPNQSAVATWTFAEHYGLLQGLLLAYEIPVVKVRPQVWQKGIGAARPSIPKGASPAVKARIKAEGKRNIKEIVEQRFPYLKITLATSDALGILMYADKTRK